MLQRIKSIHLGSKVDTQLRMVLTVVTITQWYQESVKQVALGFKGRSELTVEVCRRRLHTLRYCALNGLRSMGRILSKGS